MNDVEPEGTEPSRDLAAWRDAYAAGLRREAGECPSEDRLAALVVGDLTGNERAELADHVVACPRCTEAYRTLGELHRAATASGPASESRRTRRRAWLLAGAAAAVLAAAVGLAVFHLQPPPAEDRGIRGAEAERPLTEPPDGARLSGAPELLSWRPAVGATETDATYRVLLYDAEAVPLWRSAPTASRSVELPPALRERLAPGTYYWRVRTEWDLDRSETPLLRFEITP